MIDHLSPRCADVAANAALDDTVLGTVGGRRIMDFGDVVDVEAGSHVPGR